MITIVWILLIIAAVVIYLRRSYSKLSNDGVHHMPVVPLFGNLFWALFGMENITDAMTNLDAAFPEDKVVGWYEMFNPVYLVKDIDTIKNVTTKDFDHFTDRRGFAPEEDPTFGRGLLSLKGDEWKAMRSTLSPAFTSSKIRLMVPLMVEVGKEMNRVLSERIKESENQYIDIELKDVTTRYANDVIATCAFGLKVDSQSIDSHFYLKAKDISTFGIDRVLKVFLFRWMPSIAKMLNLTMSSPETSGFFTDVVLSTMAEREKKNIIRNDMINILNEIKRGNLIHGKEEDTDAGFATVEESNIGKKLHNKKWSDSDLVAQAILFLFAGFDTISRSSTFIIHELAVNPDVQEKLVQEIKENDKMNDGKFDFQSIQTMKYMDMVVSEGLRLHPPAPFLDRVCVRDYNFGRVNKSATKDLIVRKGANIGFPIWILHRSPELFPNPTKFDPERFSEENRHKIKPFSYVPFGLGPRNCIGSRFALCEIKVMLYLMLRELKVTPCEKTSIPIEYTKGPVMNIKNGAWVRLQLRQQD